MKKKGEYEAEEKKRKGQIKIKGEMEENIRGRKKVSKNVKNTYINNVARQTRRIK